MRKFLYLSTALTCLLATNVFAAGAANEKINKQIISSFAKCDGQFFNTLSKYKSYLSRNMSAEVETFAKGKITFNTPDFIMQEGNVEIGRTQQFSTPLVYKSLTLTSYDMLSYRINKDDYYFWGFKIKADNIEQVLSDLKELKWVKLNENEYVSNAKIYHFNDKRKAWRNNPYVAMGIAPEVGTAEKILVLSATKNEIAMYCSLQGEVPHNLLFQNRPDLKNKVK